MSFSQKVLPITLSLILFVLSSNAQTQNSGIFVTVKNQLGEVIPNAEIRLVKSDQVSKTLKSNKSGVVQFSNLASGDYQLNISAVGFNPYKSELIKLSSTEIKKIEVELEIKLGETNVVVGGDDDVESSGTTRVMSETQIQRLPDDPKRLEQMLRSIAGESATGEKMPITVDGQPDAKLPPTAQIQAVRINQNVFSAQYDNANGWGIEIYTRSGADKFTGSISFNFEDSRFNAPNPFIGQKVPSQSKNVWFSLTGPITKKSMFSISLYPSFENTSKAINAAILDSNLNPTSLKTTFPANNTGFGGNITFSADVNKKNKIVANYSASSDKETGAEVGNFALTSRAGNRKLNWQNFRFSESYFASENLINQFRAYFSYSNNRNYGASSEVSISVLEAFEGGGSQNNNSQKSSNFEVANDTSWQKNKYSVNFGWQFRGWLIRQTSTANYGGTYTFSGRTAPVLDANNNPVAGQIAQIDSLETYRRTLLFQKLGFSAAQIRALGGGASQFTISGGNPTVSATHLNVAGYIQNSYKLKENLALSFGIRYENQNEISSNFDIAPRLGLIWSPKAKKNNDPKKKENVWLALPKISFGYGIFYRRYGAFNFLSIKQATGADRATYLITDPSILDLFPIVTSVSQLQQFALPKTQRFISPDLQTPRMQMINFTASKKLPAGFSANVNLSYSKSDRQTVSRNINAIFNGLRPLGNVGNVYETNSIGRGEQTRLSVTLNLPEKVMYGNIRYSFVKAKNNIVTGSGLPANPFDFSQEFAPTSGDGVHSISGYLDYDLPFGFSLSGSFSYQTGSRFNITTGKDTNGDGYFLERPAFASDLTKPNLINTKYGVLDPNPSSTDKIIPRNLGRGSSNTSFDVYLSKSIKFGEDKVNKKPAKQTLSFNMSIDNIFNIVTRANPIGNMSSPNFLKVLSSSGYFMTEVSDGVYYGSGSSNPRSISFGMSFRF